MLSSKLMALVAATADIIGKSHGDEGPLIVNPRGDLRIAQSLPPAAELVRMGRTWQWISTTPTAPVTALPTTTAGVSIRNGESAGGRSYVVHVLFSIITTSAGAATGLGIAACMNIGEKAALTDAAIAKRSLTGMPASGTKAQIAVGQTVTDDGWYPVGDAVIGPANNLGMACWKDVGGLFIIPPGHQFNMQSMANTGTAILLRQGLIWSEVNLGPIAST